jgi:hypothetical protein
MPSKRPHLICPDCDAVFELKGNQLSCLECSYARSKIQALAGSIANTAMRQGRISRQPCEVCGNPKVDAHHDDYSRPLKVRWLCRSHHRQHHARTAIKPVRVFGLHQKQEVA